MQITPLCDAPGPATCISNFAIMLLRMGNVPIWILRSASFCELNSRQKVPIRRVGVPQLAVDRPSETDAGPRP
jgi:hypothetical protein